MKWAIREKFSDYLYGHFAVYTDNNPFTYVLSTARLGATGHRWLAALASYDFSIKYRPGVNNADADALSRPPAAHKSQTDITSELSQSGLCAVHCNPSPTWNALLSAKVIVIIAHDKFTVLSLLQRTTSAQQK